MKRLVLIGEGPYYETLKGLVLDGVIVCSVSEAEKTIRDLLKKDAAGLYVHTFTEAEPIYERLKAIAPDRIVSSAEAPGAVSELMLKAMETLPTRGAEIERLSFEILAEDPALERFPPDTLEVVKRLIHATGDRSFARSLVLHPKAIGAALKAIVSGMDVVTDVQMVKAGINRSVLESFGGRLICALEEVPEQCTDGTRTERAIEAVLKDNSGVGIVAIGNAPTALVRTVSLLQGPLRNRADRTLVVGFPVGFVRAVEAKVLLSMQAFPFITNINSRGGSPAAAAAVNALLYMAREKR